MNTLLRLSAAMVLCAAAASAQNTQPVSVMYEMVSTVKPNPAADGYLRIRMDAGSIYIENATVRDLLANTYGVRGSLIFGLPKWAEQRHFDVRAKVLSDDAAFLQHMTRVQRREIFERLLAERFSVKSHREERTLPVYELVRVGPGPQLVENAPPAAGAEPEVVRPGHNGRGNTSVVGTTLDATGVRIGDLCANLGRVLDRNVVDKTGLTSYYDITLHWRDDLTEQTDNGSQDGGGSPLFVALQEQLGLKLNNAKGLVEVLVVDAAALPKEN